MSESENQSEQKDNDTASAVKGLAIIAVIVLVFVAMCSGGDDEANDDSAKSSSDKAPAASEPVERKPAERVAAEVEDEVDSAKVDDASAPKRGEWSITFKVDDNLSKGMIRDGAKYDVLRILRGIHEADVKATWVSIEGTFPLVDKYGEESQGQVVFAGFDGDTLDKINYKDVEYLEAEELATTWILHPDLRE